MPRQITIANTYTIAANTEQLIKVYRVPAGSRFRLKKVVVIFPPGTENYLLVSVRYGIRNVCPEQGYVQGEDTTIPLECEFTFESDSEVVVYAKNTDTAESRTFSIVIIGEELLAGETT